MQSILDVSNLTSTVNETMQTQSPEEIPGIPEFTCKEQEMILAILNNKHWGKGQQHGLHMQRAWRIHWQYRQALDAYSHHALRCDIYDIMGGEPPPGCNGIPPAKLLPAEHRRALAMVTREGATLSEACSATGIDAAKLEEIYVRIREQLLACAAAASDRFRKQALRDIEESQSQDRSQ